MINESIWVEQRNLRRNPRWAGTAEEMLDRIEGLARQSGDKKLAAWMRRSRSLLLPVVAAKLGQVDQNEAARKEAAYKKGLELQVERTSKGGDAYRIYFEGTVNRQHVRGVTATIYPGLEDEDPHNIARDVVTTVLRTDGNGKPATYAAKKSVVDAVASEIERMKARPDDVQKMAIRQPVGEPTTSMDDIEEVNDADADVTIRFSPEGGLTIETEVRDYNDTIKNLRRLPGHYFKWSRNLGAWYRPKSIGFAQVPTSISLDYIRNALMDAGATVALDIQEGTKKDALEARVAHSERRADYTRGRAKKYADKAEAAAKTSQAIGDRFWMGQPILVGHHSEKRARRDQAKMHAAMTKSIEAQRAADSLHARARNIEATRAKAARELGMMDHAGMDALAAQERRRAIAGALRKIPGLRAKKRYETVQRYVVQGLVDGQVRDIEIGDDKIRLQPRYGGATLATIQYDLTTSPEEIGFLFAEATDHKAPKGASSKLREREEALKDAAREAKLEAIWHAGHPAYRGGSLKYGDASIMLPADLGGGSRSLQSLTDDQIDQMFTPAVERAALLRTNLRQIRRELKKEGASKVELNQVGAKVNITAHMPGVRLTASVGGGGKMIVRNAANGRTYEEWPEGSVSEPADVVRAILDVYAQQ